MSGTARTLGDRFQAKFDHITGSIAPKINLSSKPQGSARRVPLTPRWTGNFSSSTPVDEQWERETGDNGWGNNELQNYTTSNDNCFYRDDGNRSTLVLRAIASHGRFTSARLTSKAKLGRSRGYLSARITAPSAKGIWPAFWLLPSEPFSWPQDGEVDIMESWNGVRTNHACLHWGHYNGEDHNKHRVMETPVPSLDHPNGLQYGFAWDMDLGKLVWFLNERAIMQADIPRGTRGIDDFQIKLNIAVGGNVNEGQRPADGVYEMIVHEIGIYDSPFGGWDQFAALATKTPHGHTM